MLSFEHAVDTLGCSMHDGDSCLDRPQPLLSWFPLMGESDAGGTPASDRAAVLFMLCTVIRALLLYSLPVGSKSPQTWNSTGVSSDSLTVESQGVSRTGSFWRP